MAFDATSIALGPGLTRIREIAATYKQQWLPAWDQTCQLGTTANIPQSWAINIVRETAAMQALADIPGMAEFARVQLNKQPGYDIVAEFIAMKAALVTVASWIIAGLQAPGTISVDQATGETRYRAYSPAELSGLRTLLAAAYATIG